MTPRGIEILVKKASVDGAFRRHLLKERSGAAARIGMELDPAEAAVLDAIPEGQLIAIIEKTKVAPLLRPNFMGYAAAAMLAAVGLTGIGWAGKPDEPVLLERYLNELQMRNEDVEEQKEPIIIGCIEHEYTIKINKSVSAIGADLRAILGDDAEDETRTKEAIHVIVEPRLDSLLDYHTREIEKNPDFPSGSLTTCFRITPDGKTTDIEILDEGQGRGELKRAIIRDIRGWRFEPAKGEVYVIYNLVLYRSCEGEEERKWGKPFRRYWYNLLYGPNSGEKEIEVVDDEVFYEQNK